MSPLVRRRPLTLMFAATCCALAVTLARAAEPMPASDLPDRALPQAWRALRATPGQFEGAPWRDDVDRWQGRKHVVMQRMAAVLRREGADRERVTQWMGAPDVRLAPGSPRLAALLAALAGYEGMTVGGPAGVAAETELWLYRWRADHDRLALVFQHGALVASGWLHDLE